MNKVERSCVLIFIQLAGSVMLQGCGAKISEVKVIKGGNTGIILPGDTFEVGVEAKAVDNDGDPITKTALVEKALSKQNISYRIKHINVASIDGSTVTAKNPGDTEIDATVNDIESSLSLHVQQPVEIINLVGYETTDLQDGQSIKYQLEPEDYEFVGDRYFKQSDESILTVDEDTGFVTPVQAGTATVYASTSTGAVGQAEIKVRRQNRQIEIQKDKNDEKLPIGDTVSLTVVNDLEEIQDPQELKYETSNSQIATVSRDGLVSLVGVGTVTITVTDIDGVTQTCSIVTYKPVPKTSIWGTPYYPQYGSRYATISCDSAGIDTQLLWGDDQGMLNRNMWSVCQYSGSAPIGQTGAHLLLAHNNCIFGRLQRVRIGDLFVIKTQFGQYVYKVDSACAGYVQADGSNIVANGRNLVRYGYGGEDQIYMYTCYPFGFYGATNQRYVVRATLVP